MKTKKTAFMAAMWLAAFGLLGAPSTPAVDILPTVGGQAHAAILLWVPQCPGDKRPEIELVIDVPFGPTVYEFTVYIRVAMPEPYCGPN